MTLTLNTFLIVCPLVFLAGLVDAIGGGGGLISLPAYLLAGLPVHTAVATNKLSSCCGTATAAVRFIKEGLVNFRLAVPAIICAMIGSSAGSFVSMMVPEHIMQIILYFVLPAAAFLVLNKKLFHDRGSDEIVLDRRTVTVVCLASLVIGFYDGFYGPGTGTFLIIALTVFAGMSVKTANAQTKIINLTTNVTSLAVFLLHGQVLIPLGLAAAAANIAGGWLGAGLVMKQGSRIVRPSIMLVLVLLAVKIIGLY
ncbi:MAG: sulfite exporter TauE/SafE family protein [Eubacteriaceae bacterium]|jgi:uncharacterized membrane protein YfcA